MLIEMSVSRTGVLEESNRAGVGRYTWSYGSGSTIGALFTTRQGDEYRNHVAGVDGDWTDQLIERVAQEQIGPGSHRGDAQGSDQSENGAANEWNPDSHDVSLPR